ncbi:hypothetical protein A9Q99_19580 [Gammaproteobacteria bacterium 45_16_T64]|nr:hypothetical protein A9Q99_19580 [Gammaproteobacteria bacterium 45_16_T64]
MNYGYGSNSKLKPTFKPEEHYDITDERFFIPNHITHCSLRDLLDHPSIDISFGSLLQICNDQEFENTHCRNNIIISDKKHTFHSQTFEEVKRESPLIHSTFGLSAAALVELANIMGLHDGIYNHSYVRICPELIFSLSDNLKYELQKLDSDSIPLLAKAWHKSVLEHYEAEEPENVKSFWFGWITIYEHAHYSQEYFSELLLNIHELLRSCEESESLYFSVDY